MKFTLLCLLSALVGVALCTDGVETIDISPLRESPAGSVEYHACARKVVSALSKIGLFLATGHGIEESSSQTSFEQANKLFRLPEKEKLDIKMGSDHMRGYIPFGEESGLPGSVFEPKEGFAYGFDAPKESSLKEECTDGSNYLKAPNVWPKDSEEMKASLYKLYEQKVEIARLLSHAVIDDQESVEISKIHDGAGLLRSSLERGHEIRCEGHV